MTDETDDNEDTTVKEGEVVVAAVDDGVILRTAVEELDSEDKFE